MRYATRNKWTAIHKQRQLYNSYTLMFIFLLLSSIQNRFKIHFFNSNDSYIIVLFTLLCTFRSFYLYLRPKFVKKSFTKSIAQINKRVNRYRISKNVETDTRFIVSGSMLFTPKSNIFYIMKLNSEIRTISRIINAT